jgi:hypothetical protein
MSYRPYDQPAIFEEEYIVDIDLSPSSRFT